VCGGATRLRPGRWNRTLALDEEGVTVEVGLYQAGRVTSARVEQDEVVVGIVGTAVAGGISQEGETSARHGGGRRTSKA
jgi:hypothetical protein